MKNMREGKPVTGGAGGAHALGGAGGDGGLATPLAGAIELSACAHAHNVLGGRRSGEQIERLQVGR
jgi:hypothetical protein